MNNKKGGIQRDKRGRWTKKFIENMNGKQKHFIRHKQGSWLAFYKEIFTQNEKNSTEKIEKKTKNHWEIKKKGRL